MRLYCCLNPSRRARERATRGRLASHVVIAQGMRRTRIGGRTFIVGSSRRDKRSSGLRTSAKILCPHTNGNAIPCPKPKTVLHICPSRIYRAKGSEENRTACRGTHGFFCNCQTGPQCWKPPSTGLILRRPLPEAKGLEGPSRGANEATNWTILRDVKLRFPPQDEVVGFGAIPKLHPGSYESFPFA